MFICLFVWGFTSNFRLMNTSLLLVKGNQFFNLCSALMVIEQRSFFSLPHLLWHRWTFLYNGYLCKTLTIITVALPSVWQCCHCQVFFDWGLTRLRFVHPTAQTPWIEPDWFWIKREEKCLWRHIIHNIIYSLSSSSNKNFLKNLRELCFLQMQWKLNDIHV